jgi:uncharacterized Zn-finger protein
MVAIPLNGWFIVVLSTLLHLPIGDASTFRGSCEFPDALGGSRGHGDPPRYTGRAEDDPFSCIVISPPHIHPAIYLSLSLSQYIYIYLSIYIYLYLYLYIYIYTSVYIYIIYIYIYLIYIYIIHMHIIHIYIYLQVHTHTYIYSDGNNIHTNTASSNLINAPQNLAISRSRCPCPACRWAATDCASPSVTGRKREQMVDTLQKKLR